MMLECGLYRVGGRPLAQGAPPGGRTVEPNKHYHAVHRARPGDGVDSKPHCFHHKDLA